MRYAWDISRYVGQNRRRVVYVRSVGLLWRSHDLLEVVDLVALALGSRFMFRVLWVPSKVPMLGSSLRVHFPSQMPQFHPVSDIGPW